MKHMLLFSYSEEMESHRNSDLLEVRGVVKAGLETRYSVPRLHTDRI